MTEILTFHADPLIFHAASEVVKGWGYDMEEAVNLFLRRFVETVPLPEHPVPREEAVATIRKTVDRNCMDMYTQPLLLPHGDVYGVELLDCALPAFVTFEKPYFGSLEDIAEFRRALRESKASGLKEMTFFTTHVYGAKHSEQEKGTFEHTNTWGFPYFIWWERLESVHVWLRYNQKYWRCLRARITDMTIDTEPDGENAHSYGEQIWGHPNIVEYRKPYHFNRMYVIEKHFESEKELLEDMEQFHGDVELKGFLDDIFGDG